MQKVTLEIPEGKEVKWVNNVLTLVDKEMKYGDIRDKVKDLEDVMIKAANINGGDALGIDLRNAINLGMNKDIVAYIRLKLIALVLNEGWEPTYSGDERKWYPWFSINKNGDISFTNAYSTVSKTHTNISTSIAFKHQELAEYAGKQFIDIYKDYLL